MQARSNSSAQIFTISALAALVFFSRAWLIRGWGSPLPFWDQWDAEAIGLYAPWINGTLHWTDLFKAHNEHRILLTRLADLALFSAYGGWNPWAQMLLNAAFHAGTAAALASVFWNATTANGRVVLVAGLAILFTATAGWQNALYGFQSGVYFANVLAVGAIAGLCLASPFCLYWWLGLLSAILAFFGNGGGILAAVSALMVGLYSLCFAPKPPGKRVWLALGLVAAISSLSVLSASGAPQHTALHAHRIRTFLSVLAHCLAWPWINVSLCFVAMQLPLVWLTFIRWKRKQPLDSAERCALALGLFWFLQAAAIAYTRGAVLPEDRPISRYHDPFLLGVAGQLFALVRIFSTGGRTARITGLAWGAVAAAGLIGLTETNFTLNLPFKRAQDHANLAIVREYAATHDPAVFTRDPNFSGPHPDPHVVQRVIDDPILRSTLPAQILAPDARDPFDFPWIIRQSPALTAASGVLLLAALAASLRRKSHRPDPAVAAQAGSKQ